MLEKYLLELKKTKFSRAQFHTNWPNSHFLITKVCIRVNIFELFYIEFVLSKKARKYLLELVRFIRLGLLLLG